MNVVTLIFAVIALVLFLLAAFGFRRNATLVGAPGLVALGLASLTLGVWIIPALASVH